MQDKQSRTNTKYGAQCTNFWWEVEVFVENGQCLDLDAFSVDKGGQSIRKETWRNWEMEKTCQLSLWSEKYSHHQYLSKLWNDPIRQKRGQTLYQLLFGLPKFQFRLVYNWRLNLKSKCSNFVQNLQFSPVLSIRVSKYLSCACCRTTSHAHYITETGPLIDPETTARSNIFPVFKWVSESLPSIKIQWQGKGVPGSHELRPGHVFRLD